MHLYHHLSPLLPLLPPVYHLTLKCSKMPMLSLQALLQ